MKPRQKRRAGNVRVKTHPMNEIGKGMLKEEIVNLFTNRLNGVEKDIHIISREKTAKDIVEYLKSKRREVSIKPIEVNNALKELRKEGYKIFTHPKASTIISSYKSFKNRPPKGRATGLTPVMEKILIDYGAGKGKVVIRGTQNDLAKKYGTDVATVSRTLESLGQYFKVVQPDKGLRERTFYETPKGKVYLTPLMKEIADDYGRVEQGRFKIIIDCNRSDLAEKYGKDPAVITRTMQELQAHFRVTEPEKHRRRY
ncbi:MAG: hypothetical protein V1911_00630 [Candidatus Micrarchaeota archaeon]